jgi:hypothetical protein
MAVESTPSSDARTARLRARERIGDLLPNGTRVMAVSHSNTNPCNGWHVASQICYEAATMAPDINSAIEWYLRGDACDTAAEACEALSSTLP